MTSTIACEKRALCGAEDLELAKGLPVDSLSLLVRGALYAQNASRPPWEFALPLDQLRAAGLNECDLWWLACKGYIEHRVSEVRRNGVARAFDVPALRFTERSSFILTPRGMSLAKILREESIELRAEFAQWRAGAPRRRARRVASIPIWDRQRRELRLGRIVVKHYRVPAENQELVLAAFEEEAWPARIDDPLPFAQQIDRKRRLHSTIQCLNRNRKADVLHFHGDGCGNGVCWESSMLDDDPAAGERAG